MATNAIKLPLIISFSKRSKEWGSEDQGRFEETESQCGTALFCTYSQWYFPGLPLPLQETVCYTPRLQGSGGVWI